MPLKYALLENLLTDRPDDYKAQTQATVRHDLESILEQMTQKGSTVTKTDALAVLNAFFEVIARITAAGGAIHTELLRTRLSVSGVFEGAADRFDPSRHRIHLHLHAGSLLQAATRQLGVEKVALAPIVPHILEVKDAASGAVNQTLTSGGVVEISGSRLKIVGDAPHNGVYFVGEDGAAQKAPHLIVNRPTRLIAMTPALPAGRYTLQVTTQYSTKGPVKAPRQGVFPQMLTVANPTA